MADAKVRLRFLDDRPVFIPHLKFHPGGITLPNDTNIINVTEGEKKNFIRLKNGDKPCFEEVREPRPRRSAEVNEEA